MQEEATLAVLAGAVFGEVETGLGLVVLVYLSLVANFQAVVGEGTLNGRICTI